MTSTNTTIHTNAFRRIVADETGFTVTCTASNTTLVVALNPDERQRMAAALAPGLVPARPITRADLPMPVDAADGMSGTLTYGMVDQILDAVVDHLNAHHPKPQPYDEGGVRGADSLLRRAECERDAAVARAEQLEKRAAVTQEGVDSFDVPPPPVTTPRPGENLLDDFPDDTPSGRLHVSAEDIVGVIRGRNLTTPRKVADAVMELLSGSDPAVFVVRESDIAAVKVERDSHGEWFADGEHVYANGAEDARNLADGHMQKAVRRFAVARAIEAEAGQADPIEELAERIESATREAVRQVCDELAPIVSLDPHVVEKMLPIGEQSRRLARHVLAEGGDDR